MFVYGTQQTEQESASEHPSKKANDYNVYAVDVPEKLDFAGERMPLNQPDVYERIDRELLVNTYWQSNGLLLIKRSRKYFPYYRTYL